MKIYRLSTEYIPSIEANAACIGFFDGVHIGHQKLIATCRKIAEEKQIKTCLITFDQDPGNIVSNEDRFQINTLEQREALYEKYGIDILVIICFDRDMMKTSPEDFIKKYLNALNIDTLICGFDFRFGFKGQGDSGTLSSSSICAFDVEVVPDVTYYGKKVSSTRIKEEIRKGNYRLADRMLGYHYEHE